VLDAPRYLREPRELLSVLQSGGVFYGGFLAAALVAWWYVRRYQLPGWTTADVLAPGVAIGQAIGRLGCFAAGCCFGKAAKVPWAVTYTDEYARTVGAPIDEAVHPTQVYESMAAFLIFLFLLWLAPRKRFQGQVVLAYVVLYATARFVLEFFRGDLDRGTIPGTPLSTSQGIALALVIGAAFLFARLRSRRPETAAPPSAPPSAA
jgi:phosphatidylglycerol:prolipoprotein diacylglycerol transferase